MTCNFRVGQKVVKIKAEGLTPTAAPKTMPIEIGSVLTIRAVQSIIRSCGKVMTGLLFEEISNEIVLTKLGPFERDYDYRAFRPVAERGTDKGMSILRNLLNKAGKPVEVDA